MKNKKNSKKKIKKSEEKKEETKLEEEVKEAEKEIAKRGEKFEFEDFEEFFEEEEPEFERTHPSLRKINASPGISGSLEIDLKENTNLSSGKDSEKDSFKYSAGAANNEEPKYHNYGVNFIPNTIPRTERENLGKINLPDRQEIRFADSPQARVSDERNFERYNPAERTDKEKLGKEDFLAKREVKYKPLN